MAIQVNLYSRIVEYYQINRISWSKVVCWLKETQIWLLAWSLTILENVLLQILKSSQEFHFLQTGLTNKSKEINNEFCHSI